MRTLKINDVSKFMKTHNPSMVGKSNNFVRSWVHFRLASNNLFFVFEGKTITGVVEWYRYQSIDQLIEAFKRSRLSGNTGPILFVNSIVSCVPSGLPKQAYRKFITYQRGLGDIAAYYRLTYKNNTFGHKRVI